MYMKKQKIKLQPVFLLILLLTLLSCSRQKIISLKTLLMEMTDRTSLTLFPDPYYILKQYSSYDRRSVKADSAGWYANTDCTHFLSTDSSKGRKEYVLFDATGPGAVVRWWMTFAGEGSSDGIIRVYIDDTETPVIEGNIVKVLSGHLLAEEPLSSSVSPETDPERRGHNLYLPIPYSGNCRITYECDAIRITEDSRTPSIYYNICYRTYQEGTRVVSFSTDELKNSELLINDVNSKLLDPVYTGDRNYSVTGTVEKADSATINIYSRNAAITNISVDLTADDFAQALRSTVMEILFDDNLTVWVPVGEFFGTGYDSTSSSTWNSVVFYNHFESYWLMPFRKKCSIRLINYGRDPVKISIKAHTSDYRWRHNSMYFGAAWHEYHNIRTAGAVATGGTGRHRDLNFIDLTGKGVYAGDAITVFNTEEAWFGEGDEKIFVDGETFPSSIGTGTEDYYGYAWCRPEYFTHPFIAQPSGDGNFFPGLTINMRYRDLDAIPFNTSISSNIELWHWVPATINYALTTYWYIFPGFMTNIRPVPMAVMNPVPRQRSDIVGSQPD